MRKPIAFALLVASTLATSPSMASSRDDLMAWVRPSIGSALSCRPDDAMLPTSEARSLLDWKTTEGLETAFETSGSSAMLRSRGCVWRIEVGDIRFLHPGAVASPAFARHSMRAGIRRVLEGMPTPHAERLEVDFVVEEMLDVPGPGRFRIGKMILVGAD